jgi:hypothetical protein
MSLLGILIGIGRLGCYAQPTGGRTGLSFLQIPSEARTASLGSRHITLPGKESTLFLQNPALLDSSKDNSLSLALMPYLADTRLVNLAYARSSPKTGGVWAGGIQYFHYGTLSQTDDLGNPLGEFRAADYALAVGYGHTLQNISIGGSLKWVGSMVENYQLWGLALDWGAVIRHPRQDLTAGFVVKNLGFLRQNYAGGDPPPLPLDVRLGITYKPEYMPLRFSLTVHHLNAFDLVYNDPALFSTFDPLGHRVSRSLPLPEKLLRHLTLGTEILLHPRFRLMLGYDHLSRQELGLQNIRGLAGVSFGAWLSAGRFAFAYGYARPGAGIATSTLGIHMKL